MKTILKCEDVKKKFGKKEILKGINLEINEGDILAFIGPNGAGKTTTIKLILGLQSITSGTIKVNGYNIEKDFVKAISKVGAIVENPDSYMYLSGKDNLKLLKNSYTGITNKDVDDVIKLVGLQNRIKDKVSKYSLGMRQRLGIAKALLAKPNLLILDEPTNGLDPEGIRDLRKLLKKLASDGIGILISSHNLSELESFCNKICIINKGQIIETSDVKEFKKVSNKYYIRVDSTKKVKFDNISSLTENSFILEISEEEIPNIIKKLVEKDIKIYEVTEYKISLEEAFLNKTGGESID